ncbi:guanine nucleotide binding protein, alpha subunit [Pisolithus croceorrhizus]|nr:guanine nucleotide binding protein, alpha subunit [Pisolithus croceorrhizus]KAI6126311.1 guanine nucleotide binding protein, alpha subunit [Pisolithus croceorrhizus]
MVRASLDDPLAFVLSPPPNETPEQKSARERAEAEARKTSEAIDEQIRQEKIALKKKKKPVKILLLGQSESGKSATLKNFQLQYAKDQWLEERLAWRAVIYLNLIRNALQVLDILQQAMSQTNKDRCASSSLTTADISDSDGEHRSHTTVYKFTDKHRLLKLRLASLRTVLVDLEKRLGPGSQEIQAISRSLSGPTQDRVRPREFGVSSNNGWKSVLDKLRSPTVTESRPSSKQREEGRDEVTDVLLGCKDDMKSLWQDPVVKQILSHRRSKIEDASGFFLDDVDRIASPDYEPADDDIVRARLRTVGVQEHRFMMEAGQSLASEWIMYDFGGTRSSRALWAAFFDDVDTIIFLAPISCFDERLREDQDVNRLEDSLSLWRIVCSSTVLAKAQIILFLNKCDILHKKMKRGVAIRDYVPSFADRKNDTMTAMKYFQQHFKELFKSCSPEPRPFFVHFTSVIDTKATATTLSVVRESVLRQHLQNASLI